jgi:cyclic pyranopterin phosphate synthase
MSKLSHLDEAGAARMVDVGAKDVTAREAVAAGTIRMQPHTLRLILDGGHDKGDVLACARVAGILAAKKTPELVPLCHAIALSAVEIAFEPDAAGALIRCRATARTRAQTGVEMEALTAVAVALLTIYDMCKAADRGMTIGDIALLSKSGGRSGRWTRRDA